MSITQRKLATGVHLVELNGPLNVTQAQHVSQYLKALAARGVKRVIVNLAHVPFIDGPGLAALITGYQLFGHAGQGFRLVGLQDQPKLVLELTGFDQIFQIFAEVSEAAAHRLSEPAVTGYKIPVSGSQQIQDRMPVIA
ncbi:MAG: STAS domain-containing protein [Anaerolineae bacterium]|nr:STAS domain-containing protein [Anaerolineae bacterium]